MLPYQNVIDHRKELAPVLAECNGHYQQHVEEPTPVMLYQNEDHSEELALGDAVYKWGGS